MKLEFKHKVFNDGLNLTVRRGMKWSVLKPDNVDVFLTKVMRFCDLKDYDLYYEHDVKCRTYEGLLDTMRNTYEWFLEKEIVTLVYFREQK